MAKKQAKIYSVSQVNTLIQVALEERLPSRMIVSGEISGWRPHSSGHSYFSLKDENGILPCVMWKSSVAKLKFEPEDGMAILATGHIDVYAPSGKYQFYASKLEPAGVGQLQIAFEQMVKRLTAEGLFKEEHKKAIPPYPMRIGIFTSASGAAVMDIVDSIYNRWPCGKMLLCPVAVQGEGAAEEIAKAIGNVNRRNKRLKLDVLIVGRGGGSLEDLWAFNEEILARAIFASKIPVISAVGHEIDVTIADLVADARASTPTKAGVIAVPDINEILAWIEQLERRLDLGLRGQIELRRQNLRTILASAVFRNPQWLVNNATQRIDEISMRLGNSASQMFVDLREQLSNALEMIRRIEPHRLLAEKKIELNDLANFADAAVKNVLSKNNLRLTAVENRLAALNPKSVLNRGYSITTSKKTGQIVANSKDVNIGDTLVTELGNKNLIESEVKKT
jgi:exodeoxyribonuclease VII large subunit